MRCWLFGLLMLSSSGEAALDMSPLQRRGEAIYLRGTTLEGVSLTARLSAANIDVPSSIMPCVNCHGYDGRGGSEGGVFPSDIRNAVLRKPYGNSQLPGARSHSAYTRNSLKRAIAMGVDPSGNPLNSRWPMAFFPRFSVVYVAGYSTVPDPILSAIEFDGQSRVSLGGRPSDELARPGRRPSDELARPGRRPSQAVAASIRFQSEGSLGSVSFSPVTPVLRWTPPSSGEGPPAWRGSPARRPTP